MGQLLNYVVYVLFALQLDSSSEGIRLFRYCFGVSYHSYLSTLQQLSPIRDSVTIFIVSYQWDEEPFFYGSHNTGYSYMMHEGPLSHGSHNTGFSYQWD